MVFFLPTALNRAKYRQLVLADGAVTSDRETISIIASHFIKIRRILIGFKIALGK